MATPRVHQNTKNILLNESELSMTFGYVIVEMQIVDMDQYKQYMAIAPESIRKAGGEYLVRGGELEVLEGDWTPKRMAVVRFPSYLAAKAWYDGEQYTQARSQRMGATSFFNMVLLDGVAAQV
jgi:uncharacterized protein (DUF1330 family)